MTRSRIRHLFTSLLVTLMVFSVHSASACAVCFGKSDSNLAKGMKWGVAVLLLVVFLVLGVISSFFVYLAKRSASTSGAMTSSQPDSTQKVL